MNKGFTIIEFMILITLISVLSVVFILGTQGEEEKLALQRASLEIFQDIREVEEMAMAAHEVDCGINKTYSFGLYFHPQLYPDSYLIFADCDENNEYNGGDVVIRHEKLEKRAQVYRVNPFPLNIVFYPPDPIVAINNHEQGWEGRITLSLKSNTAERIDVEVNTVGKIEITK